MMSSVSVVLSLALLGVVNSQGVVPVVADQCFEPVSPGPCRAYIPSFYFNPLTGSCDCFIFGGCKANGNKFARLEECMTTCSVRPKLQTISPTCIRIFGADNSNFILTPWPITPTSPVAFSTANPIVTTEPAVPATTTITPTTTSAPVRHTGPVVSTAPITPTNSNLQTSDTTVQQGNQIIRNNEDYVGTAIADQCFEPVSPGPCRAFIPSFYFNPLTGSCDCFIFGGCKANGNKFARLEECMTTCSVRPNLQMISPTCIKIFGADNSNFILTPRPITTRPVAFSTTNPLPIVTLEPALPAKVFHTITASTALTPTTATSTTSVPVRHVAPVVSSAPARPTSSNVQTSGATTTATSTTSAPVRHVAPVVSSAPARPTSSNVQTSGTTIQQGNQIIRKNVDSEGISIAGSIFSQQGVSGQTTITIGEPVLISRRTSNGDDDK